MKYWKALLFSSLFASSLVVSHKFTDPFFVPKNIFFFFAGAIFIAFAIIPYFNKKKYYDQTNIHILDLGLIILAVYLTLRLVFTDGVPWGNVMYFQYLLCLILYFLAKPLLFSTEKTIRGNQVSIIVAILQIIALVHVLWGILEFAGVVKSLQPDFSIGSSFGNPGQYANFITPILAFSLGVFLFSEKKNKWLAFITSMGIIIVLPITQARTSWIAAVAIMLYLLEAKYGMLAKLKNKFNKVTLVITAISIIAIALLAGNWLYNHKKESASGRVFIWSVSTEMIADKPLLGFGFDRFAAAHNDYQAQYFDQHPNDHENAFVADGVNYAFNEWIQIAVETGIPGALILVGIFILGLTAKVKDEADKESKVYFHAAKAALLGIAVSMCFSYPMHTISTFFMIFFALAIIAVLSKGKTWKFQLAFAHFRLLLIIVLVFALLVIHQNYNRNKAERQWTEAFQHMRQKNYNEAYLIYNNVYETLSYNQFFLFNYGAELNLMKRYEESVKVLRSVEARLNDADFYIYLGNSYENLGNINEAEDCYKKAGNIMPYKFFPKYRLVNIYRSTNRIDEAKILAKQMISMPVKVQSPITDAILKEMNEFLTLP